MLNQIFPATSSAQNASDFTGICSAIGQRARCCVLPIVSLLISWHCFSRPYADMNSKLEQGVLCQAPLGA